MSDSWKDSYDEWKLRSPDDDHPYYEDEDPDECHHEEYEINWDGTARCGQCGRMWDATVGQIVAERKRVEAYIKFCRREERRAKYARWFGWMAFWRKWKRKPKPADVDSEIPF